MIASSQSTKEPSENSILVLDLSGQLSERAEDNIINQIQGTDKGSIGLDNILTAIKKCKREMIMSKAYISKLVPFQLTPTHPYRQYTMPYRL